MLSGFWKEKKESLFQLIDFYSLFHLTFIENNNQEDAENWQNGTHNTKEHPWSDYAFELIGLTHIAQIKKSLGISGIQTATSSWVGSIDHSKAQLDLVIDRRDHVISICEFKFSFNQYIIDKEYAETLKNKMTIFRAVTKTKKAIQLNMITTYGLQSNIYSNSMVQKDLTMDIFFE